MQLIISHTGALRCLYDEALDLHQLGRLTFSWGAHGESDPQGQRHADLSPEGGPVLGPFPQRSEALAAERAWLEANWLMSR
jgi:hypothetical protein